MSLVLCDGNVYVYGENLKKHLRLAYKDLKKYDMILFDAVNNIVAMSSSSSDILFLTDDGKVFAVSQHYCDETHCERFNESGNNNVPKQLKIRSRIKRIVAAASHNLFLSEEGDIYISGEKNKYWYGSNQPKIPSIIDMKGVKFDKIYAGCHYTIAISTDGEAYGQGLDSNGYFIKNSEYRRSTMQRLPCYDNIMFCFSQLDFIDLFGKCIGYIKDGGESYIRYLDKNEEYMLPNNTINICITEDYIITFTSEYKLYINTKQKHKRGVEPVRLFRHFCKQLKITSISSYYLTIYLHNIDDIYVVKPNIGIRRLNEYWTSLERIASYGDHHPLPTSFDGVERFDRRAYIENSCEIIKLELPPGEKMTTDQFKEINYHVKKAIS